jgi:hypothetical protein
MANKTGATGTAVCPFCAGDRERVLRNEHVVSGSLVTKYSELIRHRDESQDPQVEIAEDVLASRPATREVEIDGLKVSMPTGFRPHFSHLCPTVQHAVTLYADTEGGSVQ